MLIIMATLIITAMVNQNGGCGKPATSTYSSAFTPKTRLRSAQPAVYSLDENDPLFEWPLAGPPPRGVASFRLTSAILYSRIENDPAASTNLRSMIMRRLPRRSLGEVGPVRSFTSFVWQANDRWT